MVDEKLALQFPITLLGAPEIKPPTLHSVIIQPLHPPPEIGIIAPVMQLL